MDYAIVTRLMDEAAQLRAAIEEQRAEIATLRRKSPFESEQLNEFAPAFAKAKAEFRGVFKGQVVKAGNFSFNFANLNTIFNAVDDSLSKHGLTLYFYTQYDEGLVQVLRTRLLHSSGQWIESRSRIVPKNGEQREIGSAMTYQRRYQALCLLGIAPSDDPSDDDGEAEQTQSMHKRQLEGKPIVDDTIPVPISFEQLDELEYELQDMPELAKKIKETLNIRELADMDKSKFMPAIRKIRELKLQYQSIKK